MQSADSSGELLTTKEWWEQHRLRYNVGLVAAGLLAFALYVLAVERGVSAGTMPGAEITVFTTMFQAVGYLIMMGVANLTFGLGFWFSVLLPFSIPLMVAWSYLIRH